MHQLNEFVKAPRELFAAGHVLEVDLYIYLPQNKTILHYRRKGDALSLEDINGLNKIPPENLIILRSDRQWILNVSSKRIGEELKAGNVNSVAVKVTAASVLKSIDPNEPGGGPASGKSAREVLNRVPQIVEEVMNQFKRSSSVEAYDLILKSMKSKADPLTAHNQQVSALAVLIMLTVGNFTLDEISDTGAAGLVHDLGLSLIPPVIMERHLQGDDDFNSSEKLIFMKHTDIAIEMMRSSGITLSPGIERTLLLHHENWDGSGFKGIDGTRIYRPARVLRIADDIVSSISHPSHNWGFKEAMEDLSKRRGNTGMVLYDPDILKILKKNLE